MNSEQARFILRVFRPGVDRPDAPEFAQAFDRLRQDPELAEWFEREMAGDAAIRRKLSEAVVFPPGLREPVAASGKVVRTGPRVWWRRPTLVALAASVVLLLALGIQHVRREPNRSEVFVAFRESVVTAGQEKPHISFMDSSLPRVREYLQSQRVPDPPALPARLQPGMIKGCRVLEWNGRKVSLICLDFGEQGHVDLFVIQDVAWDPTGPRSGSGPLMAQTGGMNTVSWTENGCTYILAAKASPEALRRLLSV
ncbi:MAG: hypothetical protein IT580_24510 [Verrucomicrobiales bacterium]|nr:hypothetical protein [Verrucomicrobiales bacterium]